MADVDWRTIRTSDCEFSVKARAALIQDHGPQVTIGDLDAKTDAELLRSPNVGRKTLNEVRSMIATLKETYPTPVEPAIFLPHAQVDWSLLARAIQFYTSKGYRYVEVPWAVSRASVDITCPNPAFAAEVNGLGCLVGSAEQSFLHLDLAGKLGRGKFCALTPCFRLGDTEDGLHHPYFMKVELYVNSNKGSGIKTEGGAGVDTSDEPTFALLEMLSVVGQFNKSELGEEVERLSTTPTEEGVDVELNGIEIGSYGIRRHGDHVWVYGTGVADPRFSQARARV